MEEIDDDLDEQGIVFVKLDDEVAKTDTYKYKQNKKTKQVHTKLRIKQTNANSQQQIKETDLDEK